MLAWLPRVDGRVLMESPLYSVMQGRVADVPLITGMLQFRLAYFASLLTTLF